MFISCAIRTTTVLHKMIMLHLVFLYFFLTYKILAIYMRISLLQDSTGLLAINGFALPPKIAEKRKIIEEIAHNDVKKVSRKTKKSLFRVCLCVCMRCCKL